MLGDSVTTDHISPAGSIKPDSPAGRYLQGRGVERKDFNSYGSRRGNHEVMMRGTFANIRIKNEMLDGVEGGYSKGPDGQQTAIYDAAMAYEAQGVPLVVVGGIEYGAGSSRDWAAKGTNLLGVKAVIAQSFARIHKANLVNAGILPFTFANEADYDRIDQMDQLELAGIRTAMENNTPVVLKNLTKNEEYPLDASHLSARQRAMLLCGGLLDYTRDKLSK